MGSVIKKRRKRMSKKKHRKLLFTTPHPGPTMSLSR
ncbi:MAG: 30S ribosomal protein bS22 [Microbacterium gubbeenense]